MNVTLGVAGTAQIMKAVIRWRRVSGVRILEEPRGLVRAG